MTEEMNRFLQSWLKSDIRLACDRIMEGELLLHDVRAAMIAGDMTEAGIETSKAQVQGWFLAQVVGRLMAVWNTR